MIDPISLTMTGVAVASLVALHAQKAVVPRFAEFEQPPDVLLYRGTTDLTLPDVEVAFAKLVECGHEFGRYALTDSVSPVAGAIVIGPPDAALREHVIASAHIWATSTPTEDDPLPSVQPSVDEELWSDVDTVVQSMRGDFIEASYISWDPMAVYGKDKKRILVHEAAHAIGYGHTETALFGRGKKGNARLGIVGRKSGHVQNPLYSHGGWNMRGLAVGDLDPWRKAPRPKRKH